jgi:hypothetical protein
LVDRVLDRRFIMWVERDQDAERNALRRVRANLLRRECV